MYICAHFSFISRGIPVECPQLAATIPAGQPKAADRREDPSPRTTRGKWNARPGLQNGVPINSFRCILYLTLQNYCIAEQLKAGQISLSEFVVWSICRHFEAPFEDYRTRFRKPSKRFMLNARRPLRLHWTQQQGNCIIVNSLGWLKASPYCNLGKWRC